MFVHKRESHVRGHKIYKYNNTENNIHRGQMVFLPVLNNCLYFDTCALSV